MRYFKFHSILLNDVTSANNEILPETLISTYLQGHNYEMAKLLPHIQPPGLVWQLTAL